MNQQMLDQLVLQLKKKHKKLRPYFSEAGTDCYREHSFSIGNSRVFIDRYGENLHISISEGGKEDDELFTQEDLAKIAGALYIRPVNIHLKTREKLKEHKQYTPLDDQNHQIEVHENGLAFMVNLQDYIDTGLFLDHRKTRRIVGSESLGKKILNLFAYTGAFSVYAASGGAEAVTTVDLSATYLDWAQENFRANDLLPGMFEFVRSDVAPFLTEARKQGRKWDLIILDPPTFSNSRKMDGVWDIQKNHIGMLDLCSAVLAKDGVILFSTNYRQFQLEKQALFGKFQIDDITHLTTDEDFLGKPAHRCWKLTLRPPGQENSQGRSHSSGRRKPSSGRKNRPSSGSRRKQ